MNDTDEDSSSDYESEDEEVASITQTMSQPIQIQRPQYEVNIDFDEASAAWRTNKHRNGQSWIYNRVLPDLTSSVADRVKTRRCAAAATTTK
jgi:hypothetical protein